jgi:two-component system, NtrC family, nitrogen regulation sensor histidine kinase NtrY
VRLDTLRNRIALAFVVALAAGALLHAAWLRWPLGAPVVAGALGGGLLLAWWLAGRALAPLARLLRTLEGAVLSYRDGDFSASIAATAGTGELAALVHEHNALGHALREQRQHLAQRELLLDTVVQNTPLAMVLTLERDDASAVVVYANIAARQLLGDGRSLEGSDFGAWLAAAPAPLRQAVEAADDTLFTVPIDGTDETFHLLQRAFRLQGRPHRLHLFRRMTRELSRQEVATWKRVIRVISHELNNSLAPISSLAHSGAELARRGDVERLPGVFQTIGQRARHLHGVIDGYARFAKLPAPRRERVEWAPFLAALAQQQPFALVGALPPEAGMFDPAQVEQALINVLKNAHEAGGGEVTLAVTAAPGEWRFEVGDHGPGMSDAVLAQALLPFYSTKRAGTGLGLALAREIAEAHGGRIALANRASGGLKVTLAVAATSAASG